MLTGFYDLFVGVSSFAAGWLAHHLGYSAPFLMAAGALVAAAVAAASSLPHRHRRRAKRKQSAPKRTERTEGSPCRIFS